MRKTANVYWCCSNECLLVRRKRCLKISFLQMKSTLPLFGGIQVCYSFNSALLRRCSFCKTCYNSNAQITSGKGGQVCLCCNFICPEEKCQVSLCGQVVGETPQIGVAVISSMSLKLQSQSCSMLLFKLSH